MKVFMRGGPVEFHSLAPHFAAIKDAERDERKLVAAIMRAWRWLALHCPRTFTRLIRWRR